MSQTPYSSNLEKALQIVRNYNNSLKSITDDINETHLW